MREVEVTTSHEALSALVPPVESGGEILLTREGRTIARIVPVPQLKEDGPAKRSPEQQARIEEAMQNIRNLRNEVNLGPFHLEQFKRDRDEGRL